ncbi:Isy1-like splicing family-domain-containing protein [Mycena galopus ATCC 62051]|nr:Isy1-like splicing family-domain-containing protein [Mycena galopus ATCC 62051]
MESACMEESERVRARLTRDATGLSDYELRDLNDEINKQMREKRHWENQIVALGGTNYRRNVAMLRMSACTILRLPFLFFLPMGSP